jgi:hypothetical protein
LEVYFHHISHSLAQEQQYLTHKNSVTTKDYSNP